MIRHVPAGRREGDAAAALIVARAEYAAAVSALNDNLAEGDRLTRKVAAAFSRYRELKDAAERAGRGRGR